MKSSTLLFPKGFLWGAATSSFQIEGSPLADGAAESDWYRWTKTHKRILNGENADLACDHYNRVKQDVALMKEMGLKSYRFSLSWPRIVPERGRRNPKALDFYRSLLEELHQADIQPFVTLFHWETPVWAEGGWENRETAIAFGEYAELVFGELGHLSEYWATQNEPLVVAAMGHLWGLFPPGKTDLNAYGKAVHHLNLAHGLALREYRQLALDGKIGRVQALGTCEPVTQRPEDIAAARKVELMNNRVYLEPSLGRGYDPAFFDLAGRPEGPWEKDLKTIAQPEDFVGVNHYFRTVVRHSPGHDLLDTQTVVPTGAKVGDMGPIWEVRPKSFGEVLRYVWKNFPYPEIFVTENGIATRTSRRGPEEILQDDVRIHYLGTYLEEAHRVIQEGIPLKGYFVWSLFDNFEWAEGYDPLFGLIRVEGPELKRVWKKSAHWYAQTIRKNGFDPAALPVEPRYLLASEFMKTPA